MKTERPSESDEQWADHMAASAEIIRQVMGLVQDYERTDLYFTVVIRDPKSRQRNLAMSDDPDPLAVMRIIATHPLVQAALAADASAWKN